MATITGVAKNPGNTATAEVLFERYANIISGANTVSRQPVRATPDSSTGAFSTTLLAGFYRYYPDATQPYFYEIEVGGSNADVTALAVVGSAASETSRQTYFATMAAAKAHTGFTEDRTYWIAGDGAFMSGAFTYDSDSAVTADESDVIDLDTMTGRLLRLV